MFNKMKVILWAVSLLLFATNLQAGVCNNGSLVGPYSYVVFGVDGGTSFHNAGRLSFDGKGSATVSGVNSENGYPEKTFSGSGVYTVSASCVATGYVSSSGLQVNFWLYLDQMDYVPATNRAYHASVIMKASNGDSLSGELFRVQGKFR